MGTEAGPLIAVVSLILAVLGAVVGAFKYFSSQDERLREKLAESEQRQVLLIDKMQESATKALTAIQTILQASDTEIRRDVAAQAERLNQLSLDAVRKTDLAQLEQRFNQLLAREINTVMETLREIKAERAQSTARLEAKIDSLIADRHRPRHAPPPGAEAA